MEWSTVAGLSSILGFFGLLVYAAFYLLSYGEKRGVEKTLLKIEKAGREARDKIDEITDKKEEEYEESLNDVDDIDFDDANGVLFDDTSSETSKIEA